MGLDFFITATSGRVRGGVRQHFPETIDAVVAEADHIANDVFELLGSGPRQLGQRSTGTPTSRGGIRWEASTIGAELHDSTGPTT